MISKSMLHLVHWGGKSPSIVGHKAETRHTIFPGNNEV